MPHSCIVILAAESPMLSATADALRSHGAEVHFRPLTDPVLHELRLLLPDVVVATDLQSDAELLRVSRCMRDNLGSQYLTSLILIADSSQTDSLPSEEHARCGAELAASLVDWLQAAAIIRHRRDVIDAGLLSIDRRRFLATLDGRSLPLTMTEFRLLCLLADNPLRVFRRSELYQASGNCDAAGRDRTIDVHIRALRRKLSWAADLIHTVRGVGYRFDPLAATCQRLDRAS